MQVCTAPVAPGRLPLVGHALSLARAPLATLQQLRELGDAVIVHLGRQPVYVLNSPDLIREVQVSEADKFVKGRFFAKARAILGGSISTSNGEEHGWHRRMVATGFHREHLRRYTDTMRTQVENLTGTWQTGERIRLDQLMPILSSSIVVRSLLHSEPPRDLSAGICKWMDILIQGTMRRIMWPMEWLERLPTRGNREFNEARQNIRGLIGEIIAGHRPAADRGDLLSNLLAEHDSGHMDRDVLHDEILTMLVAGTETVATATTWLYHELGRNVPIRTRLEAELDVVLSDQPVSFDDLAHLSYTRHVIHETLRLYSPAWFSMRRAISDVTIHGVHIPAGCEVLFSSLAVHRDPVLYSDPLKFDPDRWTSPPPRELFLPFGDGKHRCIGSHFAITEMTIAVATISRCWRLLPVPGHTVREIPSTTFRPDEMPMITQRRTAERLARPAVHTPYNS